MRSAILLLLGALTLAGCDRQSAQAPQANEAVHQAGNDAAPAPASAGAAEENGTLDISNRGKSAPDIIFEAPDGAKITLATFKGKPVLVNLWATWCGPCVKEMPTLDALAAREKGRLTVLTVAQDDRGAAVVDPWFAKKGFKALGAYIDSGMKFGDHYATGVLPTTVLYDAEGKEVWRVVGSMNWDGPRANTLMAETLG